MSSLRRIVEICVGKGLAGLGISLFTSFTDGDKIVNKGLTTSRTYKLMVIREIESIFIFIHDIQELV